MRATEIAFTVGSKTVDAPPRKVGSAANQTRSAFFIPKQHILNIKARFLPVCPTGWNFCCAKETHPCFLFFFYFVRLFRSAESRAPAALMLRPGMHTDCTRTQRTRVSLVTALVTSPRGITDEEKEKEKAGRAGASFTQGSVDQQRATLSGSISLFHSCVCLV